MESAAMQAASASSSSFAVHDRSRSNSSLSGSDFASSQTSSGATDAVAALATAFDDDDDDFGAFAAARPPPTAPAPAPAPALSPPAATNAYYANVFRASSSSVSSLVPPPPTQLLSSSGVSVFSQSGLSEISFADDEYDNPFADIVNEAPKSAGGSRTNSSSHIGGNNSSSSSSSGLAFESLPQQPQTQASGGSIEVGSPLLSFSPVVTPSLLSMPPSVSSMPDIFATTTSSSASVDVFSISASSVSSASNAPTEAELLSFSPLALSSSAPSAVSSGLSSFMLDASAPATALAASSSKPAPRFSLPPPRAATMSSLSPGAVDSVKTASFSGQVAVSVGELLSFSPVASAPVSSFSDSIGSSAAATASIFGDDELFSLSTTDLTTDFPTRTIESAELGHTTSASPPPASAMDVSPMSFGDSIIQDFMVDQSAVFEMTSPVAAITGTKDAREEAVIPLTEAQVDVIEAQEEGFAFQQPEEELNQEGSTSSEPQSPSEQQTVGGSGEETQHELNIEGGGSVDEDSGAEEKSAVGDTSQDSPDASGVQRMSISVPLGYSQFDFITQGFSPQANQEHSDDTSEKDPFSSSSPLDASQYQPFSQDSLGDQYTSMGDLSDEEFGGYSATTPVQPQGTEHFRELNGTSTGSETANTPTGQLGGSVGAEYASFSSNDSDSLSPRVDGVGAHAREQLHGEVGGSPVSTSPTMMNSDGESDHAHLEGFESVSASKQSQEQKEHREEAMSATSSGVHNDDFDDFGGSPSATLSAMHNNFSDFEVAATATNDTTSDDEFGGFGAAPVSEFNSSSLQTASTSSLPTQGNEDTDEFGGFSASSFGGETADDFGDFMQSSSALDGDDDDFGDFGQSSGGLRDDDDFGDFGQSSSAVGDDDGFSDFHQSTKSGDFGASGHSMSNDDDFGDFGAPPRPAPSSSSFASMSATTSIAAPSTSKGDLDNFFRQAFPAQSAPTPLDTTLQVPAVPLYTSKDLFHDKGRSNELIASIYLAAVESYFQDSSSAIGSTIIGTEHYSLELKALRLKHLKYVLTEKIQEASRHDGIFPHGSEKHHVLLSLVNSDDERKMRDALTSVQDSIFNSSVNDAMMRIARQAALSAKAKIAEQAAHQQASSRGSLLATTRQLLSRSGGGGTGAGTTGRASDKVHGAATFSASSASLGVLTPTGASVHKISRFGFAGSGHDNEAASASGNGSGDDSGGENASDSGGRNSYNEDISPHTPGSSASARNSGSGGSSSGGGGGLMKKFQDRFSSFSSSRSRTRLVSLRRMGQSGEDVRKMELNMDSISGGLDEVKWKCAVFLYDVDEVSQVAPSQITILSYPSKEVLTGKSDRTALMKFLKPGAIWTIDIGALNNDVLNEW